MNAARKLKIGLYLTAIFAAGFVTGTVVTVQVARHMMPGQQGMVERWCHELQSKMNLTPAQMDKIRPIVSDALGEIRNRMSGDMLSSLSNCNARIVLELTPEQKPEFDKIQKEQDDMIRAIFRGGTNQAPNKP
jgi:hypothetical protein